MKRISDWNGASGGSRDNYPELLAKSKENFEELFRSCSSRDNVAWFDDFNGDVLDSIWTGAAGSDAPAAVAITEAFCGKVRITTGDSNASLAADGSQLCSFLNWRTTNGLVFETRLQVSAITNVQLFVGMTDQRSSIEMPATLSVVTYTTVATDAVGFLFDTAATVDTIRLVGVANDVDATHQDTGVAFVAATDMILRIEVDNLQNATFYINNVAVGTVMALAIRGTVSLTPVFCIRAAGDTTPKNLDVDYVGISMPRA